jgi:molybdenum cofactor guanylyltransferase
MAMPFTIASPPIRERHEPTSAVILAGGGSRRLGQDKRRLRLWGDAGPTLLERTLALAAALCDDVLVVLNDPHAWPELPARVVADRYPGAGALGGIATGLAAARAPHALVLACDLPLLNPQLLAAMLARPRDYDALLPRSPLPGAARNGMDVEPLHAIYAAACRPALEAALARGERQVAAALAPLRLAIVERDEIRRHDPHGRSCFNLNTPAQLAAVLQLILESSAPSAPSADPAAP